MAQLPVKYIGIVSRARRRRILPRKVGVVVRFRCAPLPLPRSLRFSRHRLGLTSRRGSMPASAVAQPPNGRSPHLFQKSASASLLSWSKPPQRFPVGGLPPSTTPLPLVLLCAQLRFRSPCLIIVFPIRKLPLRSSPSSSLQSPLAPSLLSDEVPIFFQKTASASRNIPNVPFVNSTFLAVLVSPTCLTPLSLSIHILIHPDIFLLRFF